MITRSTSVRGPRIFARPSMRKAMTRNGSNNIFTSTLSSSPSFTSRFFLMFDSMFDRVTGSPCICIRSVMVLASGRMIQSTMYTSKPIPTVMVKTTNRIRTTMMSIPKYAAIPPETPASTLFSGSRNIFLAVGGSSRSYEPGMAIHITTYTRRPTP